MIVSSQKYFLYFTFSTGVLLIIVCLLHNYGELNIKINTFNNYHDHQSRSFKIEKEIVTDIRNETVPGKWGCGSKYEWSSYLSKLFNKYESMPSGPLQGSPIQNIEKVTTLLIPIEERYLKPLSLDSDGFEKLQSECNENTSEFPVFVTGTNAHFYPTSQALLQNIDENVRVNHKDMKLIFYDLGLRKEQQKLVKDYCIGKSKCEFRMFKFHQYPDHVKNLKNYAFKPIIIQEVLAEYDFVFWLDASIRLTGNRLEELFSRAKERGIQVLPNDGPIAQRTALPTFHALNENPMAFFFYPEIGAGAIPVVRNKFTMNAIIKPWTLCALYYGCMDYEGSEKDLKAPCERKYEKAIPIHSCHRFDQSALGIILSRLYLGHRYLVKMDFKPKLQAVIDVQRGNSTRYFCKLFNVKVCV